MGLIAVSRLLSRAIALTIEHLQAHREAGPSAESRIRSFPAWRGRTKNSVDDSRSWPALPEALSGKLKRLAPPGQAGPTGFMVAGDGSAHSVQSPTSQARHLRLTELACRPGGSVAQLTDSLRLLFPSVRIAHRLLGAAPGRPRAELDLARLAGWRGRPDRIRMGPALRWRLIFIPGSQRRRLHPALAAARCRAPGGVEAIDRHFLDCSFQGSTTAAAAAGCGLNQNQWCVPRVLAGVGLEALRLFSR